MLPGGRITLVAVLLALLAPGPAGAQFSVRPVTLVYQADGEEARVVTIRNDGGEPIALRLHPGDWDQSQAGRHRFLEPGAHPRSCHGRLEISPDQIVIEPGREAAARVRLAPGGTCWSVVFVEYRPGQAGSARAIRRIAIQVHGVPPRALREGRIRDVEVEADGGTVRFVFENIGEAVARPEGRVEVRTLDGEVVGAASIDPFGVLPGHAREVRIALPADLPGGPLLVVPILDFGGEYLAGGRALIRPDG